MLSATIFFIDGKSAFQKGLSSSVIAEAHIDHRKTVQSVSEVRLIGLGTVFLDGQGTAVERLRLGEIARARVDRGDTLKCSGGFGASRAFDFFIYLQDPLHD